jgi:hypothetical protein
VAAQQREVKRIKSRYKDVTEQLQRCPSGRGKRSELVREQRFLAREMEEQEEQEAELTRYEHFIMLIEQGATKDEACEQILEVSPGYFYRAERFRETATSSDTLKGPTSCRAYPKLEGQQLRQVLLRTHWRGSLPTATL